MTVTEKQLSAFSHAAKALEYNKILELWASKANLEGAKEKILSSLPETDIRRIKKLLSETEEAKKLVNVKGTPSFFGVKNISDTCDRAEKGALLTIHELINVGQLLSAVKALRSYGAGTDVSGVLAERFSMLQSDRELDEAIRNTFISDDAIADNASDKLAEIRRKIRVAGSRVREALQKYVSSPSYTKYLQENIITMRNSRYVLAVKAECKNNIPGLVHDTSASGSTVFVEPTSVVELNNTIRVLEGDEKQEIERILYMLSAMVSSKRELLLLDYDILTALCVIFSRADLAVSMDAICPKITENGAVNLIKARHPLISKEKVVPININVGDAFDTLVITGPNTGGKTVSLKTVGLFSMMAQTGLEIPCDDMSELRVFDNILADIGDEQSIEQSLSTFSSHMVNIVTMMVKLSPKSLVLFDELGAGTDPVEGAALAMAILEHVRESGALAVATTHYAELKAYALETPRVRNGACEFDVETLRPTYRLIIGAPGRSNAFLISEKLGLDKAIIDRARESVDSGNKQFENVVEKLEEARVEAEKSRAEADKMRRELKEKLETATEEREKLLESARNELDRARVEANRILTSARTSSDYVFQELDRLKKEKDKAAFREEYAKSREALRARLKLGEKDADIQIEIEEDEAELPRELVLGDIVLITTMNKEGVVERIQGDTITVKTDKLSMKVNKNTLRLLTELKKLEGKKKTQKSATYSPRPDVKAEIDLRGMTGDDAWFMVDKYLDDAKRGSLNAVTLIHGKGTGALRAALWRYLKSDKRVASFHVGAYGEGDFGVTVVELK